MHFEDDVQLMLDMTAVKTWFHKYGGSPALLSERAR